MYSKAGLICGFDIKKPTTNYVGLIKSNASFSITFVLIRIIQ